MDLAAKKELLRKIPYGLYVIGVKGDEQINAFTGSWLSQASMTPPLIMTGLRKDSRSLELLKEGRVLSVNFIRKENRSTLEHFFKPVKQEQNRLGDIPFHTDQTGCPILDEAIGYLEANVLDIHEHYGDHAIVVAEIINAKINDNIDPLILSDTPWHYGG